MGLGERFLNNFGYFKKGTTYLDERGNPKTIISTTGGMRFGGISSPERNEASLKKYWEYYEGDGTIFSAINTTAWNTVMVGYILISDDPTAKKFIQDYLDYLNFDEILLESTKYTLIFGDSFIEKVKDDSNKIISLKSVDPKTMTINVDNYGNVVSYQQIITGVKGAPIDPPFIIHFRFFPKPSNPYGMSIEEPSRYMIEAKSIINNTIKESIQRHGTTKYVVKVGTPTDIPPPDVFTDIKKELEDITASNEFIIPGVVDIEAIDEKGIQGVKEYYDYFQTQLTVGLLVPEEAMGLGKGSTEATSKVKEIMYERMIRSFQNKLANQIRIDLINDILVAHGFKENSVKLKFNAVTDADEAVKAKWMGNLLRGYFPEEGKPFTKNEIRAMFDFPPVNEESLQAQQPQSLKKKKTSKEEITDLKREIRELKYKLEEYEEKD